MEKNVNLAAVGVFVVVLTAAFIATVLWLGSGKWSRKSYDTYLVYTSESVSGLNRDAAVRYRGVQVGSVRRIELAKNDVERVVLTLDIEQGTPIKEDTVATLSTQGLTGISHIELAGGNRDAPPLTTTPGADFPIIKSAPSLMVRLDAAVSGAITNLSSSSERFNALLDDANRAALKELLANLAIVSRSLTAQTRTIESGIANASRAAENTAKATESLPQMIQAVSSSAAGIDKMALELTRAGTSAASSLDGVRSDAGQFAVETLPEAQALLSEMRELTASLRRISEQVEKQPAVLLRGRPPAKTGPGE